MNLSKLFEMQKELDDHIIKEKHLEGQDLLPNLILALQVELGKLAQEWRGFKHWSNDQKPRTKKYGQCFPCAGTGVIINHEWKDEMCPNCHGLGQVETGENPLLEEYVDCLHFILSIGLNIGTEWEIEPDDEVTLKNDIIELLLEINQLSGFMTASSYQLFHWNILFFSFVKLGEMLGFTWDEVEQAYYVKNKVNHERQVNGY